MSWHLIVCACIMLQFTLVFIAYFLYRITVLEGAKPRQTFQLTDSYLRTVCVGSDLPQFKRTLYQFNLLDNRLMRYAIKGLSIFSLIN